MSLEGVPLNIDERIWEASEELGGDWAFDRDYNDGAPLGMGESLPSRCTVSGTMGRRIGSLTCVGTTVDNSVSAVHDCRWGEADG